MAGSGVKECRLQILLRRAKQLGFKTAVSSTRGLIIKPANLEWRWSRSDTAGGACVAEGGGGRIRLSGSRMSQPPTINTTTYTFIFSELVVVCQLWWFVREIATTHSCLPLPISTKSSTWQFHLTGQNETHNGQSECLGVANIPTAFLIEARSMLGS
jgi:hypothetical protein